METKLTLRLDKEIIERAKKYAKQKHASLSNMVENYFHFITSDPKGKKSTDRDKTPITYKLSGSLGKMKLEEKKEITQYLMEKYIRE